MAGQFKQGTVESGPTPMTADERVMSQLEGEIGGLVTSIKSELTKATDEDTISLLLWQLEELLRTRRGDMDEAVFHEVNNLVWGMSDARAKREIADVRGISRVDNPGEPVRHLGWPFNSLY